MRPLYLKKKKKKRWGGRERYKFQRERIVLRSGDLSSREAELDEIFPEIVMLVFIIGALSAEAIPAIGSRHETISAELYRA